MITLKKLREYRKAAGMTQAELARRLGVSKYTVSGWERGIRFPERSTIQKLSEILDVPLSELLDGSNKPVSFKVVFPNNELEPPEVRSANVMDFLKRFWKLDAMGREAVWLVINKSLDEWRDYDGG